MKWKIIIWSKHFSTFHSSNQWIFRPVFFCFFLSTQKKILAQLMMMRAHLGSHTYLWIRDALLFCPPSSWLSLWKLLKISKYYAYWNPLCLYVGINADFSSLKLAFTYFSISNKLCFYTWNMAMDPWSLFRSKWTWQHWVHPNWPLNWVLLLRKCNDSHSKLKILQQLPKK